ncbi:MAG TPA: alpha-ketoglutarate-dependent dioxygenase AlkB [Methylocystis sp.]|nr:alpha-ketoglutarate-dependent dioxygenase AlkB [Methylocystis sp.]
MPDLPPGAKLRPGLLDPDAQAALARDIANVIAKAPLYVSTMPRSGAPMSVRMTNCGDFGWFSDRDRGYRYEPRHPLTGESWPPIPPALLALWAELADYPEPPQACLVNVYDAAARMGLHQDRDEKDFDAPVLSVSLGADCRFRLGGAKRGGATQSFVLRSGDVLVLGGESRLRFHGVDRILPTLPPPLPLALLAGGARINLTLRRVT